MITERESEIKRMNGDEREKREKGQKWRAG